MTLTVKPIDILRRLTCLLLIALLLTCSYLLPTAHAALGAVAAAAGAKEVIAGILIAGGVVFASSEQARDAADKIWDTLVEEGKPVVDMLTTFVGALANPAAGLTRGIRISQSAFDQIVSTYRSLRSRDIITDTYSGHIYDVCTFETGKEMYDLSTSTGNPYLYDGKKNSGKTYKFPAIMFESSYGTFLTSIEQISDNRYILYHYKSGLSGTSTVSDGNILDVWMYTYGYYDALKNTYYVALGYGYSYLKADDGKTYNSTAYNKYPGLASYPVTITFFDEFSRTNDVVYPSDKSLVLAPDLPSVGVDEDGKELVTYPHDLSLNPADHVVDIPIDATGDLVDVPYDVPVNVGTGEQVGSGSIPDVGEGEGEGTGEGEGEGTGEGTGTGTGVTGNIFQKFWDWLKGLLEAIRDGIVGLLTAITSFFDSPADFSLDFSGFQNLILPERFPFCIPFDLINSIKVFAASAQNFTFQIDLDTQYFKVNHTVDLSPYAVPIAFFRYTCVVWWCWVLILRTRDMIKW